MHNRLISVTRAWAAILALILASSLSCGLLAFRGFRAHQLEYAFFVWNLFLAWVPAIAPSMWKAPANVPARKNTHASTTETNVMIGLAIVEVFSSSGVSGGGAERWSSALGALVPIIGICTVQIGFGFGVFLLGRSVYRGGQS